MAYAPALYSAVIESNLAFEFPTTNSLAVREFSLDGFDRQKQRLGFVCQRMETVFLIKPDSLIILGVHYNSVNSNFV